MEKLKDQQDESLPGKEAAIHERTACGKHQDGSYYLRATDANDAEAIQAAAKKHGITLSPRKAAANHHGREGVYPHFHTDKPEHIQKIMQELAGPGEAGEVGENPEGEGTGEGAEGTDGGKHIHIHLHEGGDEGEGKDEKEPEGRTVQKAHVEAHTRTVGGKIIQVHAYDNAHPGASQGVKHAHEAHSSPDHPTHQKWAEHAMNASHEAERASHEANTSGAAEDHQTAAMANYSAGSLHGTAKHEASKDTTKDLHEKAKAAHKEAEAHHLQQAHQTTIHEAIGEADKKDGTTKETYETAAHEAGKHSRGLELGGGTTPTAEAHYAAHEAHGHAAKAARAHAEALRAGAGRTSGTDHEASGYEDAANRHDKAAAWHKYLGDSKMNGRGVKKALENPTFEEFCQMHRQVLGDLQDAAQRLNAAQFEPRNITKAMKDFPEMNDVRETLQQAREAGVSRSEMLEAIQRCTAKNPVTVSAFQALLS